MLGLPVQVLQKQTTSKEFVRWRAYLHLKPNQFDPLHYYLAQIACLLVKVNDTKRKKLKVEEFLIEFSKNTKKTKLDAATLEEKMQASKKSWFSAVGLNASGERREKTKIMSKKPPRQKTKG